jgi:hypothetical protein
MFHVLSALRHGHVGVPGLVQRQMNYSAVGGRFLQFIQPALKTVACLHVRIPCTLDSGLRVPTLATCCSYCRHLSLHQFPLSCYLKRSGLFRDVTQGQEVQADGSLLGLFDPTR